MTTDWLQLVAWYRKDLLPLERNKMPALYHTERYTEQRNGSTLTYTLSEEGGHEVNLLKAFDWLKGTSSVEKARRAVFKLKKRANLDGISEIVIKRNDDPLMHDITYTEYLDGSRECSFSAVNSDGNIVSMDRSGVLTITNPAGVVIEREEEDA